MTENNPLKYFTILENRAKQKLIKRYDKPLSYHDVKIINDILYNEKTHYVEQFKEYLIYEDYNEFLKRFYKTSDLEVKLPKILNFYEKYSKIYANYTVIPESKYMYKNIKRKQKMIDQMQNNGINESEYEKDEESNEEMSNTVFSSKVMNSIYRKTLTTLNKSENDNSEQSINDFVVKINNIENKINNRGIKNNFIKNVNKNVKSQKEITILPMKKFQKEFLTHKHTPKSIKLNNNKINNKKENLTNRTNSNNNQKNKIINIQFTYSKKNLKNELNKNKTNANLNSNNNINTINKKNNNNANINNNPNLIFINSYVHKNNNSIFNNNISLGNTNNSNSNNSNTFQGQKNSLNINNISKQKLPAALLKQSVIKNTNNINNYKDIISVTNINNYFTNANNNLKQNQKNKLSLGETLLKCDKVVLSTNSSCSPNIINKKIFSSPNGKNNIFNSKKQLLKEKQKHKENLNQPLSSNKIMNTKKIKSQLLGGYSSVGSCLTYLSNKFLENQKLKNLNKLNKKKINKKILDIQSTKDNNIQNKETENYLCSESALSNINFKKPESHRNYCHSKILSGNNTNDKSKNNNNNNTNNNFKITVGLKHDLKNNSQKIISSPCSPSNSGTNFYFRSNMPTHKDSGNNLETNIKQTLEEYNKKKIVNYNIVNNIHDNSTQINIYTGNELYKSLHFHNNSVFNSSNMTPAATFSKSPIGTEGIGNKNKKNINSQAILINNTNNNTNSYFQSNIKGKEKHNKYNLNLKKIIHKRILEGDKAIISERQMTRRKLFEKLGKYFFKNENNNTNNTNNINNYNSITNNNPNSNINIKLNINKHNNNKHNIIYNNNYTKNINNDYNRLINKIINKSNSNSSKILKNKTHNNTPIKGKINPSYITKNHRKMQNICLSPHNNDELKKLNKASSRQNINYNNIISHLNDIKNVGFDDENKLLIHSERNKNSKIVFK